MGIDVEKNVLNYFMGAPFSHLGKGKRFCDFSGLIVKLQS